MKNKIMMQQVHGNNCQIVNRSNIGQTIPETDCLITTDKNVELVVRTADCLPISIVDNDKTVAVLIHAGWKGLDKQIIKSALQLIKANFSVGALDLRAQIGPHICKNHYEVKDDVANLFKEITVINNKKKLSLKDVAINQMVDLGINIENIEIDKRCTFEDNSLPSFRRDKTSERLLTTLSLN